MRLDLAKTDGMRQLEALKQMAVLKADGLQVIERDASGRSIYLRYPTNFRNKPGLLEVRNDGLTFTGEVAIDVPWATVVHVARTDHIYQGLDYFDVAIQEGKRRTPTKFAFPAYDHGAQYACEVVMRA